MTTDVITTSHPAPTEAVRYGDGLDRPADLAGRVLAARWSYTTRHARDWLASTAPHTRGGLHLQEGPGVIPCPGDLVLARVTTIGQHKKLEAGDSRRATLFPGDEVVVVYGHRYAPDQFEGIVPDDLSPTHLIAAGGLAATVTAAAQDMEEATALQPVGLLADAHGRLTLQRTAPVAKRADDLDRPTPAAPVISVLGSSMNCGKTTSLAYLARGLTAAGKSVAVAKVTGTGAGGDPGLFRDAGASLVLDFTDLGYPSTYRCAAEEVRQIVACLVRALDEANPDVILLEVADGLYQGETAALLSDPFFQRLVDRVLFAASDALGAAAGVTALRGLGYDVAAVSGRLNASPLAAAEAASVLAAPVIDTDDLAVAGVAEPLLPTTW